MRIRFHTALKTIEEKRIEFIFSNPNYYCAAAELVWYATFLPDKIDQKRLKEFYGKMDPVMQSNAYGKQIGIVLILLDFWASGCGPCRLEHKNYVSLYNEFRDNGFEIVSVSQDQSKKRLMEAMRKDEMSWICLWDESKKVSNGLYNVSGLPTNYLIIDGKVVAIDLRGEELRRKLEDVLNKSKN